MVRAVRALRPDRLLGHLRHAMRRRRLARAAHRRDPEAAARHFAAFVTPLPGSPTAPAAARHRILVLQKVGLNEDISAAFAGQTGVALLRGPRHAVKALAHAFLPPHLDDNNYVTTSPADDAAKAAYREFLCAFWPALQRHVRLDAAVSGNFCYYAERELAGALERLGTPFVVLHKENMKSPGRQAFFERVYRERRGPFHGRRILVYNEIERQTQIRAGVAAPDRIRVVGMPRLDRVHARRRALAGQAAPPSGPGPVLFFSFAPKVGLPFLPRKRHPASGERYAETFADTRSDLSWQHLWETSHRAVLALARAHPSIPVHIKVKDSYRETGAIQALLGDAGPLPANVRLVVGGDPLDLIFDAAVVCGFNSTALLEAVAAGKPVVTPAFAEAAAPDQRDYIVDLSAGVTVVDSPEALQERLATAARQPRTAPLELPEPSRRLLEDWLGNADGLAGRRAAEAILSEIDATHGGHEHADA
ncbi:MAG: hypothetical protein ACOCX4_05945 [Planctomycetota bacterium]